VILEIYKSVGNKIRTNLGSLRQAQLEMLDNGFAEIDGVAPARGSKGVSPNKGETIQTNINPKGGSGPGSKPGS
jgi:hypothetical protein